MRGLSGRSGAPDVVPRQRKGKVTEGCCCLPLTVLFAAFCVSAGVAAERPSDASRIAFGVVTVVFVLALTVARGRWQAHRRLAGEERREQAQRDARRPDDLQQLRATSKSLDSTALARLDWARRNGVLASSDAALLDREQTRRREEQERRDLALVALLPARAEYLSEDDLGRLRWLRRDGRLDATATELLQGLIQTTRASAYWAPSQEWRLRRQDLEWLHDDLGTAETWPLEDDWTLLYQWLQSPELSGADVRLARLESRANVGALLPEDQLRLEVRKELIASLPAAKAELARRALAWLHHPCSVASPRVAQDYLLMCLGSTDASETADIVNLELEHLDGLSLEQLDTLRRYAQAPEQQRRVAEAVRRKLVQEVEQLKWQEQERKREEVESRRRAMEESRRELQYCGRCGGAYTGNHRCSEGAGGP